MREVYVAENLELSSKIIIEDERLMAVLVSLQAYKHLGFVDEAERTEQLREEISKETKYKEKLGHAKVLIDLEDSYTAPTRTISTSR